jgi:DNA-binding CsgD family transcriptional regulator
MGKAGRPPGPTGPKCVALFRRGLTQAAIARELGLTPGSVWRRLTRAGIDPGLRRAEARAKFAALWNAAPDLGAAAHAAGRSESAARARAAWLRQKGYRLKRMPARPHADGKTARIERLLREGVPVPVIARQLKVSKQYLYTLRKRLDAEQ